jgi:acetyl-CoA carboxylase carboxyl transferase subunit beta
VTWFKKTKEVRTDKKGKIPEGLWVKCDGCREIIYRKEIEKNLKICPKCNYHFRISARERLKLLVDDGTFVEMDENITSADPIHFKDVVSYKDRLKEYQKKPALKRQSFQATP